MVHTCCDKDWECTYCTYKGPLFVHVYSDECGVCRKFGPEILSYESLYPKVKFIKMLHTTCPHYCRTHDIAALPACLFYDNGVLVSKVIGYEPATVKSVLAKYQ